jgi:hypothetical protein
MLSPSAAKSLGQTGLAQAAGKVVDVKLALVRLYP